MSPGLADLAAHRALVTGGLGFVGSNLARRLADLGCQVVLVDSLVPRHGGNRHNLLGIEDRVRVNLADLRDPQALGPLVEDADVVFNLAGQSSHMDSIDAPFVDLDINARAQLNLLEACRERNPGVRIVFASTRQVYGRPDAIPVPETHPARPVDLNGVHKLAAEWYHLLYGRIHGLRTTVLRLTNTYGPRMRVRDARQTFLGVWIRRVVEGRSFDVWDGAQVRDFTYVDDAVEAFLLAAASDEAEGRIFNIGGEEAVTLRELADLLVKAAGSGNYRTVPFPADRLRIDIGSYAADDRAARQVLGWKPAVPLHEGLARTVAYYREHLPRYVEGTA